MTTTTPIGLQGVWLPLITPFREDRLDEASFRRLVAHYAGRVQGFVLAATTGEGLALTRDETRRLVELTDDVLSAHDDRAPVILGLCGASTAAVVEAVRGADGWPIDGFLIASPHYVRPSQEGLRRHFETLADATDKSLVIYNIPYRTGVNLLNDTLFRLAERPNIVGIKDCCGDPDQSRDLLANRPAGFRVLAGEDAGFLAALRDGADGGITASAHIDPDGFGDLFRLAQENRWRDAEQAWAAIAHIPELLFAEPSPAPLKHALWRMGLIDSPELRLPMTPASLALTTRLDSVLAAGSA